MTPKFSIIIPVYNVAPYLRECVRSIVGASNKLGMMNAGWTTEIICVDDGSTDESGGILDEYAARDSRFRIIHQMNLGVSAARNTGLERARGDWLLFVDGDDVLKSDWAELITREIEAHPDADMISFAMGFFDEKGTQGVRAAGNPYSCGFTQFAYRRERFADVRFPEYIVGEDIVYLFKCLSRSHGVVTVSELIYHYRQRNGSAMKSKWSVRKRWDDLRHAIHCFSILLFTRKAPLHICLRYFRRIGEKTFSLLGGLV